MLLAIILTVSPLRHTAFSPWGHIQHRFILYICLPPCTCSCMCSKALFFFQSISNVTSSQYNSTYSNLVLKDNSLPTTPIFSPSFSSCHFPRFRFFLLWQFLTSSYLTFEILCLWLFTKDFLANKKKINQLLLSLW